MEIEFNDEYAHVAGDVKCDMCWNGWPKRCDCGGLVHADFGDENKDGDYWLYILCDKCESTNDGERI